MPAPNPWGVFGSEWDRFWEGWARLDPDSIESVMDRYGRDRLPPDYRDVVTIPGLTDYLVYPGRYDAGDRRELADRIRGAPDSELAGSLGRIMTALDNVQDILISVGLLGWLTVRTAPQIFGRALPVVGTIIRISDLLALLTILGQLASPVYALLCAGVGAGLSAAVPALLFGVGPKSILWRATMASGAGRRGFFRLPPSSLLGPSGLTLLSRGGGYREIVGALGRPGLIGLLVQLPQATSTIFGYGISVGGLVGMISGGAAGLVTGLGGGSIGVGPTGAPPLRIEPGGGLIGSGTGLFPADSYRLAAIINRPLADDPMPDLWRLWRASLVLRDAPVVLRYPEYVTAPQYVQCLAGLLAAQRIVFGRLAGHPWQPLVATGLESPARLAPGPPLRAREEYAALGLAPGAPLPWDLPGNPLDARPGDWIERAAPAIAAGLERFLEAGRDTTVTVAAGTLVNQLIDETWPQLADDEAPIRWELDPDVAIACAHAENHRIPVIPADPTPVWPYWQDLRAEHARRPVGKWTSATFDTFAAKHGVRLLTMLPPDAPWPAEWQAWFTQLGHTPRPRP